MIYLMLTGVVLFAYIFLQNWWSNDRDESLPESKGQTAHDPCDSATEGNCDTEPPVVVGPPASLTNGNVVTTTATGKQPQPQIKRVSFSNANHIYEGRDDDNSDSSNGTSSANLLVENGTDAATLDSVNENTIAGSAGGMESGAGPGEVGDRPRFSVGELDEESKDEFPQTMENGAGHGSHAAYETNLNERRRRLRSGRFSRISIQNIGITTFESRFRLLWVSDLLGYLKIPQERPTPSEKHQKRKRSAQAELLLGFGSSFWVEQKSIQD